MTSDERQALFGKVPISEWPFVRINPTAEIWAEFNLRGNCAQQHHEQA